MLTTTNLLIILLIVLVLILLLILIGISFYMFTRRKDKNEPEEKTSLEAEAIKEFLKSKDSEKKVIGLCNICACELTEKNHYELDHLHFCKEHFELYSDNEWVAITNQKTTADTPEAGVYIYNFKEKMWDKEKVPTYILCDYKLHFEDDIIETYVQLYVLENMKDIMTNKLEGFKNESTVK